MSWPLFEHKTIGNYVVVANFMISTRKCFVMNLGQLKHEVRTLYTLTLIHRLVYSADKIVIFMERGRKNATILIFKHDWRYVNHSNTHSL